MAQGGVRFEDLLDALKPLGLEAVTGTCPTVGLTGFSLGGGWGFWSKSRGLGADNVLSYRVVLANGTAVDANATSEPELFWALRGGGRAGLGVVTATTYTVFPAPKGELPAYNATFDATDDSERAAQARARPACWARGRQRRAPPEAARPTCPPPVLCAGADAGAGAAVWGGLPPPRDLDAHRRVGKGERRDGAHDLCGAARPRRRGPAAQAGGAL